MDCEVPNVILGQVSGWLCIQPCAMTVHRRPGDLFERDPCHKRQPVWIYGRLAAGDEKARQITDGATADIVEMNWGDFWQFSRQLIEKPNGVSVCCDQIVKLKPYRSECFQVGRLILDCLIERGPSRPFRRDLDEELRQLFARDALVGEGRIFEVFRGKQESGSKGQESFLVFHVEVESADRYPQPFGNVGHLGLLQAVAGNVIQCGFGNFCKGGGLFARHGALVGVFGFKNNL